MVTVLISRKPKFLSIGNCPRRMLVGEEDRTVYIYRRQEADSPGGGQQDRANSGEGALPNWDAAELRGA